MSRFMGGVPPAAETQALPVRTRPPDRRCPGPSRRNCGGRQSPCAAARRPHPSCRSASCRLTRTSTRDASPTAAPVPARRSSVATTALPCKSCPVTMRRTSGAMAFRSRAGYGSHSQAVDFGRLPLASLRTSTGETWTRTRRPYVLAECAAHQRQSRHCPDQRQRTGDDEGGVETASCGNDIAGHDRRQ